jgi:NADPH-dependent curcumin reductase CurA
MRKLPLSALAFGALALAPLTARAEATILFQQSIRGGVSTDAVGVSIPEGDAASKFTATASKLSVRIPKTAAIEKAFLLVHADFKGFPASFDPGARVKLNDKLLSGAGAPTQMSESSDPASPGNRVFAYDVTAGFGVVQTATGVIEATAAESGGSDPTTPNNGAFGVSGEQLIVVFRDDKLTQFRQVSIVGLGLDNTNVGTSLAYPVPACAIPPGGKAVLSLGIAWECSNEQDGKVGINGTTISTHAGGRDDGEQQNTTKAGVGVDTCDGQDNASLISVGSFGYDDSGNAIGLEGDDLKADPAGGRSEGKVGNSRLDDELYLLDSSILGTNITVDYEGTTGGQKTDAYIGVAVLSVLLEDADCDGIGDTADNCPFVANDSQEDFDKDGIGDKCDTDDDNDGLLDADEAKNGGNPFDADTDDDGLLDGAEVANKADVTKADSDGDGINDGTEQGTDCKAIGTDTSKNKCVADADPSTKTDPSKGDTDAGGVSDGIEDANKNGKIDAGETNPNDPKDDLDTDGDGVPDAIEDENGTDKKDADSDDDGLSDGDEIKAGTDPKKPDTDGDGIQDGTELGKQCDVKGANSTKGTDGTTCIKDADPTTTTDPLKDDTDGGGKKDGAEDTNKNGKIDTGDTDPNDPKDDSDGVDTDGDGLPDDVEKQVGTDPLDRDSDDDGVIDGDEKDVGKDSDGDGKKNGVDPDSDDDGIFDGTEQGKDCKDKGTDTSKKTCIADADPKTTTNPISDDTDKGSKKDGDEDTNKNGKVDTGETDPNDPKDDKGGADGDNDGLTDTEEGEFGTDPADADSDDDGLLDGEEKAAGTSGTKPDTDGDGIFDGTEAGKGCDNGDTNSKVGNCVPDADPSTTTDPTKKDTDAGSKADGNEDKNKNGQIDDGETDPNDPKDDKAAGGAGGASGAAGAAGNADGAIIIAGGACSTSEGGMSGGGAWGFAALAAAFVGLFRRNRKQSLASNLCKLVDERRPATRRGSGPFSFTWPRSAYNCAMTLPTAARHVVLASRPRGEPTPADFRLETRPLPALAEGEVLVGITYLSLDPYMRGRMNEGKSYAPPVAIGDTMVGGTVGEVLASRDAAYAVGDTVLCGAGWRDFAVLSAKAIQRKIDPAQGPVSTALGVLGMPGFTAYGGLLEIGKPKAGETVVVAAASGPVGATVGQLAKILGARAVGIAGGPEKCAYVRDELGFDAVVDHRDPAFAEQLRAACPQGIDVYFENVGGAVLSAVRRLLNDFARVPVCGLIAHYNDQSLPPGPDQLPALMREILAKRLTVRGFIQFDFQHLHEAFLRDMPAWMASGQIKYREDVINGLDQAPEALIGMLQGKNFGKLVVRVND